jgi:multidrug efflux pump subunit AcrB
LCTAKLGLRHYTASEYTSNGGRISIALKPRSKRKESATQVITRLRASANTVPGIRIVFTSVQKFPNLSGRISKAEFQYTLKSSDTEALYRVALDLLDRIGKLEGVRDATSNLIEAETTGPGPTPSTPRWAGVQCTGCWRRRNAPDSVTSFLKK